MKNKKYRMIGKFVAISFFSVFSSTAFAKLIYPNQGGFIVNVNSRSWFVANNGTATLTNIKNSAFFSGYACENKTLFYNPTPGYFLSSNNNILWSKIKPKITDKNYIDADPMNMFNGTTGSVFCKNRVVYVYDALYKNKYCYSSDSLNTFNCKRFVPTRLPLKASMTVARSSKVLEVGGKIIRIYSINQSTPSGNVSRYAISYGSSVANMIDFRFLPKGYETNLYDPMILGKNILLYKYHDKSLGLALVNLKNFTGKSYIINNDNAINGYDMGLARVEGNKNNFIIINNPDSILFDNGRFSEIKETVNHISYNGKKFLGLKDRSNGFSIVMSNNGTNWIPVK